MNCKSALIIFTLLFIPLIGFGQLQIFKDKNAALEFAVLDESVNFPTFRSLKYSYNPAFYIGHEVVLKEKTKHDWTLHTSLGFYYHKDWQFAPNVNVAFGYRRHISRFNVFSRIGVGYAHVFASKTGYNVDGGVWKEKKDFGAPRLQPSLTLGLGYKLKDQAYSPEINIIWSQAVDIPLNVFSGVHHFMGISYKFYPFK